MTNYNCIGIGTTDENGIAHITHDCEGNPLSEPGYHGSGAGETLIIASLDKPVTVESILSNILNITDEDSYNLTLTADKSIIQTGEVVTLCATLTNNHIAVVNKTVNFIQKNKQLYSSKGETTSTMASDWANVSNAHNTVSVSGDEITVTTDGEYNGSYMQIYPSVVTNSYLAPNLVIEADIVSSTNFAMCIPLKKEDGTYNYPMSNNRTGHIRIEVANDGYKMYQDGTLFSSGTADIVGCRFYFQSSKGLSPGSVTFKNLKIWRDTVLDTETTDENGEATVSYTGKHTGHLNISAECMNQSEIYEVIDATFFDDGTNNRWAIQQAITKTVENNEVLFTNTSSTAQAFVFANIIDGTDYDFDVPLVVEFDIVSYTEQVLFYCSTATVDGNRWIHTLNPNSNSHIKVVADGTNITYYVDEVQNSTKAHNPQGKVRIGFRFNANATLKIKNFIIYPI